MNAIQELIEYLLDQEQLFSKGFWNLMGIYGIVWIFYALGGITFMIGMGWSIIRCLATGEGDMRSVVIKYFSRLMFLALAFVFMPLLEYALLTVRQSGKWLEESVVQRAIGGDYEKYADDIFADAYIKASLKTLEDLEGEHKVLWEGDIEELRKIKNEVIAQDLLEGSAMEDAHKMSSDFDKALDEMKSEKAFWLLSVEDFIYRVLKFLGDMVAFVVVIVWLILIAFLRIALPFAIIFSMIPAFSGALKHWFTAFVNISLWILVISLIDVVTTSIYSLSMKFFIDGVGVNTMWFTVLIYVASMVLKLAVPFIVTYITGQGEAGGFVGTTINMIVMSSYSKIAKSLGGTSMGSRIGDDVTGDSNGSVSG